MRRRNHVRDKRVVSAYRWKNGYGIHIEIIYISVFLGKWQTQNIIYILAYVVKDVMRSDHATGT